MSDNPAYEIGRGGVGNAALSDGITFEVPQGVTMMINAGAIFKLGAVRIVAGSRDAGIDNGFFVRASIRHAASKGAVLSYNDEGLGLIQILLDHRRGWRLGRDRNPRRCRSQ